MTKPTLKIFFLFISFFIAVSLACGPIGKQDPTATAPPPIQVEEPVQVESPPVVDEPEEVVVIEEPTPTDPPTRQVQPTPTDTVAPVEEDTEEPPSVFDEEPLAFFVEEFEGDLSSWSYFLMSGDESKMDLYTDNGRLIFDLQGENQYVYLLYDEYTYSDVRLDVQAENLGKNSNNVSLICNYSDRLGWYEFNISNGGEYWILVYSELDGDWFQLANGGSVNVRTGRDTNIYTAICQGNQLALYVNGILEREHTDTRYNLKEGQVGVSVSSFSVLPILVEVDYFSISVP
jgi:hypothetical protein